MIWGSPLTILTKSLGVQAHKESIYRCYKSYSVLTSRSRRIEDVLKKTSSGIIQRRD